MSKVLIRKFFVRKLILSSIVQFILLALLFVFIKNYLSNSNSSALAEKLIIKDDFTQQELSKYIVLGNEYAFNLSLHNISEERRFDSLFYSKELPKGEDFYNCESLKNKLYKLCKSKNGVFYGITPLVVNKKTVGFIISSKKYAVLDTSIYIGLAVILLVILGNFVFNFLMLFFSMKRKIEKNTKKLLHIISDKEEKDSAEEIEISEYYQIAKHFLEKKKEIKNLEREKAYITILQEISDQVAHDIRSPLAVINSVLRGGNVFSPEGIGVIRSAADTLTNIANNLIVDCQKEAEKSKTVNEAHLVRKEPIWLLIDELIHEKKYEYRNNVRSIEICFQCSEEARSYFSLINHTEIKRALSNIINNSIESLRDAEAGKVEIKLASRDEEIVITITDNGVGIPKQVLNKITLENFSFGKEKGHGLYHAKKQMKKFNGHLSIESIEGQGTTVKVMLARCNTPCWYSDKIFIGENSSIVILDDDKSIHDLWRIRLSLYKNVKIYHFYDPKQLVESKLEIKKINLFLIDYSFTLGNQTGSELIRNLDIADNTLLVTANFWSDEIREEVEKNNLKLVPKSCIDNLLVLPSVDRLIILIDDNDSIRLAWQLAAENAGVSIKVFKSVSDFESQINNIHKEVEIYIDSNLKDNIKGEQYAKKLYLNGFVNLYLETGRRQDSFSFMPWIKKIVGKSPPF